MSRKSFSNEGIRKLIRSFGICITVLMTMVFTSGFFRSGASYLQRGYQDLCAKDKLLQIKKENLSLYEANITDIASLEGKLDELSMRIVSYKNIPGALESLGLMMTECHIEETFFYSGDYEEIALSDPEESGGLFIIGTRLSGAGRFDEILSFITKVNEADIDYYINELTISYESAVRERYVFELYVTFYAWRGIQ